MTNLQFTSWKGGTDGQGSGADSLALTGVKLSDDTKLLSTLENWSSDAIDYLSQVEPKSTNLFCMMGFRETGDVYEGHVRPFYNFSYRVRSISIETATMDHEIDPLTHIPYPTKANYPQKISISYFEDVYHSIRALHMLWWQRWYNRDFDMWRVGGQGKFRLFRLVAFHYVNDTKSGSSIIEVPKIQPIFAIDFTGVLPIDVGGNWDWGYDKDGNDEVLTINYRILQSRFLYDLAFSKKDANFDSNVKQESTTYNDIPSWNPNNFTQGLLNGETSDSITMENHRIIRSSATSMAGEGQYI